MEAAKSNDNYYTRTLAAFVANLRWEQIPPEVVARIKLLVLDTLGCGIQGSLPDHSKLLINQLVQIDSTKACTVWGTTQRLSAPHATLANSSQIQAFELDDTHSLGAVHIGSGALPPLMAIAECRPGLSGREFLTAAVAAFEAGPRVGMCMGHDFAIQGWHSGALAGFQGAAAAARALRLSPEQTVHAFGIAGTQAAGLMAAQFGAMVKRMHAGRAAQGALYGAFLAEAGYTGIANLFESEYGGFCTTFTRSTDRFHLDELVRGLGTEFQAMGTSLKFYSCAASIHTSLDAVRLICEKHPFAADQVEHIKVEASPLAAKHVGWRYEPRGLTAAQMNMPFCIATLLLEGDVFVEQFKSGAETDAKRMALANKVEVLVGEDIAAKGKSASREVHVEISLKDGSKYREVVLSARGMDDKFASQNEVVEKFTKLASMALPASQVNAVADTVLKLDQIGDTGELAKLLAVR